MVPKNTPWSRKVSRMGMMMLIMYSLASGAAALLAVATSTPVTATVIVPNTCDLVPSNSAVNFNTISPGTNSIGTSNAVTITDTGANPSNILLSGTAWSSGAHNFDSGNTVYSAVASNSLWNPGSAKSTTANIETYFPNDNGVTQLDTLLYTSNGATANTIFLGLQIPAAQYGATYTQTIDVISSC
ncbi:MAG: hypothetical protein KGI06_05500 [Candidatus Micrarchaeota archaeon]|nr:hypothetical protein [Candidatus Micrarchaeota archaeon]